MIENVYPNEMYLIEAGIKRICFIESYAGTKSLECKRRSPRTKRKLKGPGDAVFGNSFYCIQGKGGLKGTEGQINIIPIKENSRIK